MRVPPRSSILPALAAALALAACERELDQDAFQREAEKAYLEAHPGWGIARREGPTSTFVRGDQVDRLDAAKLHAEYKQSKKSASAFLVAWTRAAEAEAKARRRSLADAKTTVIPLVKSGAWIRVQDVGAIGPKHLHDQIRPWRKELATDVFVLLGIPEEGLGYRFASIEEVRGSEDAEDAWIARAADNLRGRVRTSTPTEIRGEGGRLLVSDLSAEEAISGLILDPRFRAEMLDKFGKDELAAAAPIRDALIVFDPSEFTATRPVRARAHQLYDTQNHPAFRGLIRFDRRTLSILEPANPEAPKKPAEN